MTDKPHAIKRMTQREITKADVKALPAPDTKRPGDFGATKYYGYGHRDTAYA